ncbi:anti-sigma factor [Micromonospora sp. PLK6-60]|uniref:anti-sigma factor n=1 Tax=Micromonospora sp. PLK6-60 TaxID=2873383 RepID=UPI001CA6A7E2|nr:anti-sigma factor [Micromonospora sp. PLK6-60]MBY8870815.1 anti-sigma factor [Micromonospora sp. PLK6-60]
MQHLDHDRLVFLALGESDAEDGETTHLDSCPHCRGELATLQHVAGLGADTQGLADLPAPPEHVWQGIVTEIGAAERLPSLPAARRATASPDGADPASPAGPTTPAGPARRARRRWPRWATTAVTAVAAAAVAVVGTAVVLGGPAADPEPGPEVLASAPLAAFGGTPKDAAGDARVLADGQLHLHVANLPAVPGYYEVWLINPTNMKMFSIGVLRAASGDVLLPLPPNVDLQAYSVVDVSAERYDNEPAHSGDSLLRGTLTG